MNIKLVMTISHHQVISGAISEGIGGGTYTGTPEHMLFWGGSSSDAFALLLYNIIVTEITYM